jgi:hypothetical protein
VVSVSSVDLIKRFFSFIEEWYYAIVLRDRNALTLVCVFPVVSLDTWRPAGYVWVYDTEFGPINQSISKRVIHPKAKTLNAGELVNLSRGVCHWTKILSKNNIFIQSEVAKVIILKYLAN